jgi:RNA polymerase sigma-70 factor, ECF subfamily
VRWCGADRDGIVSAEAWLTTVTSRLCIDYLRSARRSREEYVGPWLPEPVLTEPGPEARAELADSLTLGFLTLLDRLGPVERAVFLMADVFRVPFADIAAAVERSPAACRQIASRARRRVREAHTRAEPADRHLVDDLLVALAVGDLDGVLARLAPDVVCVTDGGAQRRAARRPVVGPARVARFLGNLAQRYIEDAALEPVTVNGEAGVILRLAGVVDFVAAFEIHEGRVRTIRIIRNPDKLGLVRGAGRLV